MAWYFLYVLLADYAHDFMAKEVFGNVNVGLLFGLGQFVSTFTITTSTSATRTRTSTRSPQRSARSSRGGARSMTYLAAAETVGEPASTSRSSRSSSS